MNTQKLIAEELHKFRVGQSLRATILEDELRGSSSEHFLMGPMDIERRIAGIIASKLVEKGLPPEGKVPKGYRHHVLRIRARELLTGNPIPPREDTLLQELMDSNIYHCLPPLLKTEVEQILQSVQCELRGGKSNENNL